MPTVTSGQDRKRTKLIKAQSQESHCQENQCQGNQYPGESGPRRARVQRPRKVQDPDSVETVQVKTLGANGLSPKVDAWHTSEIRVKLHKKIAYKD